jgi:hypothetical protein
LAYRPQSPNAIADLTPNPMIALERRDLAGGVDGFDHAIDDARRVLL